MRNLRPIVALLAAFALVAAAQAMDCPRAAGCAMQGAEPGSVRNCTPAMGMDCCKPQQIPAKSPQRSDEQLAKVPPAVVPLSLAAELSPTVPTSAPARASELATRPRSVPLYTLFATLLI